mgnify:CR=1 FL=1
MPKDRQIAELQNQNELLLPIGATTGLLKKKKPTITRSKYTEVMVIRAKRIKGSFIINPAAEKA